MPHGTRESYRPDIDGLRAIAILSVVTYHVGLPGISGGFTGVDIFFVISGFLITQLLCKEAMRTGGISLVDFYARRILRLLPALTAMLVTTLIAGFFVLPPFGEKQALAQSAISSLLFVANHFFLSTTGDYFSGPADLIPLLHLWSLSLEEQFYLAWPVILLVILKFSPKHRLLSLIQIAIGALTVVSFIFSTWLVGRNPTTAFFLLPSRAWELGMGALLATAHFRGMVPRSRIVGQISGICGIALVIAGLFWLNMSMPFPGTRALLPVLGTALIILAGCIYKGGIGSKILSWNPLVSVGLVSYPWYLWHWPLLSLARSRRLSEKNLGADIALALLAFLLAVLTVRFIEDPIRQGNRKGWQRQKVLYTGLAALAALFCLASGLGAWAKYGPKSPLLITSIVETPPLQSACLQNAGDWNGKVYRKACDQVPSHPTASDPLIVIWGDSYADAWSTAVRELGRSENIEVQQLSRARCPPLLDTTVLFESNPVSHCRALNSEVHNFLAQVRRRDSSRPIGVVLAANWPGYLGRKEVPLGSSDQSYYNERKGSVSDNLDSLDAGLTRTVTALNEIHIRSVILLTGPEFRIAPLRCAASGYRFEQCNQSRSEVYANRKAAVETISAVANRFQNVHVLDPISFFCGNQWCEAFMDSRPVVYDANHMSVSGAKAYAPLMKNDFQWLTKN